MYPVRSPSGAAHRRLVCSDVPGRPTRARVRLPVMLEVRPDCRMKAIVEDLSKDGFRLRSRALLHVGQVVSLHMPRGTVVCELRWVDGFTAGGVFLDKSTLAVW